MDHGLRVWSMCRSEGNVITHLRAVIYPVPPLKHSTLDLSLRDN